MSRKVPPVDLDHIIDRYLAGESPREIAPTVGVSPAWIGIRLRKAGVMRSCSEARAVAARKKPRPVYVDEIKRRYLAGETQTAIACSLEVTQASVSYWVAKLGIQISRSEAASRRCGRMTDTERKALTTSAHFAVRGSEVPDCQLRARAVTKEYRQSHATADERRLAVWMGSRGLTTTLQKAIGKYNIDVAAYPVAVELFGGGWHAHGEHRARLPQRVRDIADEGWNLLIIWTHQNHLLGPEVTDDLIAYIERSSSDPAFRRQYRMVWGDGQFISSGCVDDDQLTLVPTGIRGVYARA